MLVSIPSGHLASVSLGTPRAGVCNIGACQVMECCPMTLPPERCPYCPSMHATTAGNLTVLSPPGMPPTDPCITVGSMKR